MAEDVKERMVRYLTDAHAAEQASLKALESMLQEATNADLKTAISEHITVTQSQAQRLEARITALGGKPSAGKSMMDSLMAIGSHFANIFHDKEDKQTQDVIKGAALEELEVGTYTSLMAFANSVGDHETAQLAQTIIGEEQLARERMERLIPVVAAMAATKTSGTMTSTSA